MYITKINATSKRGNKFLKAYENSRQYHLMDCYYKPSEEKTQAFILCARKCLYENGQGLKILSFNSFQFTAGWLTPNGNLRVETAYNSYIIQ